MKIERYTIEKKEEWNAFLRQSKNGLFILDRDFM